MKYFPPTPTRAAQDVFRKPSQVLPDSQAARGRAAARLRYAARAFGELLNQQPGQASAGRRLRPHPSPGIGTRELPLHGDHGGAITTDIPIWRSAPWAASARAGRAQAPGRADRLRDHQRGLDRGLAVDGSSGRVELADAYFGAARTLPLNGMDRAGRGRPRARFAAKAIANSSSIRRVLRQRRTGWRVRGSGDCLATISIAATARQLPGAVPESQKHGGIVWSRPGPEIRQSEERECGQIQVARRSRRATQSRLLTAGLSPILGS